MQNNNISNSPSNIMQTRSDNPTNKTFIEAMLDPNAEFGGLYTFGNIQAFNHLQDLYNLDYKDLCKAIFKQLQINLSPDLLDDALKSYDTFRSKEVAPLLKVQENLYSLELYHGPTYAFKDMALQPFSKLLDSIAISQNKKYLILSATSGDTGPATLSGFANSKNIKAICIYPQGGTSEVQRLQMTTQSAKNLKVFGIKGDFDTAQSTLKSLLKNEKFRESLQENGYLLSAANSVNIGRIAFQIVYYFAIAKNLFAQQIKEFDVIVPSGNFGNALGAFFAKKLGLPIQKICIASNPNDILTEFFNTGIYDISNKQLKLSYSPAMDILKSSNIERLLFAYFGAKRTRELMESLDSELSFTLTKQELAMLQANFEAHSFDDKECIEGIQQAFANKYVLDPHTSNAYLFALHRQKSIATTQVIISTAHFSKFAKVVFMALSNCNETKNLSDKELLSEIIMLINQHLQSEISLDSGILELFAKKEIHTQSYNAKDLEQEIIAWILN